MKISIDGDQVTIYTPALDGNGVPLKDALGQEQGSTRVLTLAQYQRHMRDPAFAASIPPATQQAIGAALVK